MSLETATVRTLLAPFDLETAKLERVFGTLAARKVDYADLYFQYSRSEGWSLEEGIVKSGSFNIEQGVGVRAVSGEKTAFAYSDEISFDALQDAAKATRAIAAAGQNRRVKANVNANATRPRATSGAALPGRSIRSPRSTRRTRWRCSRSWRRSAARSIRASRR